MPVRHVDVSFSAAPTGAQRLKICSLLFQNVTDFSGYSADPVIGSYLTSNPITVVAYGDNMPAVLVSETASEVVFDVGSLWYKLTISGVNTVVSLSADGGVTYGAALSFQTNKIVYRIADQYLANAVWTTFGSSNPLSSMVAKFDNKLVSASASSGTTIVYDPDKPEGESNASYLLSNYGPVQSAATIPSFILDRPSGINKKPLFGIIAHHQWSGTEYQITGIHSALLTNYTGPADYAETVTTGGVTYRAVGNWLFPT